MEILDGMGWQQGRKLMVQYGKKPSNGGWRILGLVGEASMFPFPGTSCSGSCGHQEDSRGFLGPGPSFWNFLLEFHS